MIDRQLIRKINEAKAEVRRRKKTTPYLFNEYHELKNAEDNFTRAKGRLALAKKAWKGLGK